jgi:hypothetical protein
MSGRALSIIEAERAVGFRNLAGSRFETTFAVTQHLVDLAVARASTRRNLHGLKVTLRTDGGIGVEIVKAILGFEARFALVFRMAGPVDVASDPRLYLRVDPSLTWTTVSRFATAAGLAPEGVSIGLDGVAVNLRALAARAGLDDLLSLARRIEVDGQEGALVVHVAIDVPEGGVARRTAHDDDPPVREAAKAGERTSPRPSGEKRGYDAALSAEMLLRELKGARVRGQVTVADELANRALSEMLQSARPDTARQGGTEAGVAARSAAQTGGDGSTVARWVQRADVQFLNGRMVLDVDVVIT